MKCLICGEYIEALSGHMLTHWGRGQIGRTEKFIVDYESLCECWTGKEDTHQSWCPGRGLGNKIVDS